LRTHTMKFINKKHFISFLILFTAVSASFSALMLSGTYKLLTGTVNTGGGECGRGVYINRGALGEAIGGFSSSLSGNTAAGIIAQLAGIVKWSPENNLNEAHVYPSPFKPGSGGIYDAESIIFKNLTATAKIRVYNIAGELVAEMEKADPAVDFFVWDAENNKGEKLSSGVYIFFIENDLGQKKIDKFAVIR